MSKSVTTEPEFGAFLKTPYTYPIHTPIHTRYTYISDVVYSCPSSSMPTLVSSSFSQSETILNCDITSSTTDQISVLRDFESSRSEK